MQLKFNKMGTSVTDLIIKLNQRGLLIPDIARAERYLTHIGYYRLSAYMLPFQHPNSEHHFLTDTTFDHILNLYIFDRKLRLHVLEAIERIEISLRAQINDIFVSSHGAHGYLESYHFKADLDFTLLGFQQHAFEESFWRA